MRVVGLDYIRGFLIAIMAIDHFGGNIRILTSQSIGFVSAAEGFIFVSGLTIGIAYSSDKLSQNKIEKKIIKRSFFVYKYHILSVLFSIPLYLFFPTYISSVVDLFDVSSYGNSIKIIFLLYQPNYLDILPMYVLFLMTYWSILFFLKRTLMARDMFIFIFIYLLSFFISLKEVIPNILNTDIHLGYFDILSWQILFFSGVIISSGRIKININKVGLFVSFFMLAMFFMIRHGLVLDNGAIYEYSMMRSWLNPLRLLNFILVAYMTYALMKFRFTLKILSIFKILGRNSIQVFTFHLLLFIYIKPLLSRIHYPFLNSIISIFLLTIMFLFCYLLEFFDKKKSGSMLPKSSTVNEIT